MYVTYLLQKHLPCGWLRFVLCFLFLFFIIVALNIYFNVAVITFIAMANTKENVSWQKKLYPVNAAFAGHENHGYRGKLKDQANDHNIVLIIFVRGAVCLLWFLQPTKSYLEASLSADESSSSLSLSSVPLSSLLSSSISGGRLSKSFSKGISLSCRSISSSFSLDSDCSWASSTSIVSSSSSSSAGSNSLSPPKNVVKISPLQMRS